jgi:hypothetical protein
MIHPRSRIELPDLWALAPYRASNERTCALKTHVHFSWAILLEQNRHARKAEKLETPVSLATRRAFGTIIAGLRNRNHSVAPVIT